MKTFKTYLDSFLLRQFSSVIEDEVKTRVQSELKLTLRKEIKRTLLEMAKGAPEIKQSLNTVLLSDVKSANDETFEVISSKLEYEFYKIHLEYTLYFKGDMSKKIDIKIKSWAELNQFVKKMSSLSTKPFEEYPDCLGFSGVSLVYWFKFLGETKIERWYLTNRYGKDIHPNSDFWYCMYRIHTALDAYPELLI
jgi:hypothetical protein